MSVKASGNAREKGEAVVENIHNLTKLELVQDGGFTGSIETDHQNSHLFLSP
jgi:hypothetical protein